MNSQEKHEMVLEITHSSGEEEWNCPTCGRRLLINWEPAFKKVILQAGDEFSIHSGGKGGLRIGRAQVMPVNDPTLDGEPTTTNDDPRLAPWEAWMDESDFENRWNNEDD